MVKFHCDECVSVITRKQLFSPPVPSIGDEACVIWNGEQYSATILAMGDQVSAQEAERKILKSLESDSNSEEIEESEPPPKKPRVGLGRLFGKENKKVKKGGKKNATKVGKQKRHPLKQVQKKVR